MSKPIVVGLPSDLHCGHAVGLTPPDWHGTVDFASRDTRKKLAHIQNAGWAMYLMAMKKHKPSICIWNGDSIDGKGERSGGCEQITTDRDEQVEMAIDCVKAAGAKENYFVRGTPYHTGEEEQFENKIAKEFGMKAHDHPQIKIAGRVFDCRHKIGSTTVTYGRATQSLKAVTHNMDWAFHEGVELADVVVRSHVHYYVHVERPRGTRLIHTLTTPALQWRGTRFGKQQCDGVVDYGVAFAYVYQDRVDIKVELMEIDQGFNPLIISKVGSKK